MSLLVLCLVMHYQGECIFLSQLHSGISSREEEDAEMCVLVLLILILFTSLGSAKWETNKNTLKVNQQMTIATIKQSDFLNLIVSISLVVNFI
jgi:hypothetical protein